MVEKFANTEDLKYLARCIPKKYIERILEFIRSKRYGTISLIIQEGKIVGCDVLDKDRSADR